MNRSANEWLNIISFDGAINQKFSSRQRFREDGLQF